jgi:hypothetical protein
VTTVLESTINRIVLLQTSQQLHIHSFTNDNFDTSTTQYTETELNKYYTTNAWTTFPSFDTP